MFAPPICRRRRRNDATGNTARYQDDGRFAGSDEDGGFLANIAASGASNRIQRDPREASLASEAIKLGANQTPDRAAPC